MDANININLTISPGSEVPPWAVQLLSAVGLLPEIKDIVMPLSASVQTIVDQVTETKTIEAASKIAWEQMVVQSKALSDQVASLTAAGPAMSVEDATALVAAAAGLHDSAVALSGAVPAGVPPVVTPPAGAATPPSDVPPVGGV